MKIVEVDLIPEVKNVKDVPLDDPMKVYKVCLEMQKICEENEGIGISSVQVGIPWKLLIPLDSVQLEGERQIPLKDHQQNQL